MSRAHKDRGIIIVAAVVLACLVLYLLPGAIATVWVPACVRCHSDIADSQGGLPHADQACISCHGGSTPLARLTYRYTVMYHMVLPLSPLQADTARIHNDHCRSCHTVDEGLGIVVARGIRIKHQACTADIRCIVCHGAVGHELESSWSSHYSMNQCLRCHLQKSVYSDDGCEQCHEGKYRPLSKGSRSSFSLVHGKNWKQTHGLGDIKTCSACHDEAMCGRCHGQLVPHDSRTIITKHGKVAADPENKCASCHREQSFCMDCHGIVMPHPERFLQEHSAITRALPDGTCDKCHLSNDCDACHNAHIHPGGASF